MTPRYPRVMNPQELNKERYIALAKAQGLQAAVNQLHHDLWDLEQDCFDPPEGYEPEKWKLLNQMRIFSRELWDLKLDTRH